MTAAQNAAAAQMFRVLSNTPCRCDWTPIRHGKSAETLCARCRALAAWVAAGNPETIVTTNNVRFDVEPATTEVRDAR